MKPLVNCLPVHPGFFIRQYVLPAAGLTPAELARMMGVSKAALHYIIHGRTGISAATAVRLGAVFDVPAKAWLDLQQRYEIGVAELHLADELTSVTPYRGRAIDFDRMFARD